MKDPASGKDIDDKEACFKDAKKGDKKKQLLEKGTNKVRLSKSKTPQKASPAKKPYTRNSFIPNKDQQANKNNVTIHRGSAGPKSG